MATRVAKRDAYIGETKKQLREGYGVYKYDNAFFSYEGEWKDGKKQGHGKLIMSDGSYYEGEFDDGEINGHGFRYYAPSGNRYSGQFHLGELHGQGVMNYADGTVYEGEWTHNRRQGYGIFRLPDNSVYRGYLFNHLRHGEGTQTFANGDQYDGNWVKGQRHGRGELRCRDGTIYDGQWVADHFNGLGTMSHCSGVTYEGQWVNGRPEKMACKLAIVVQDDPVPILQGETFLVEVQTHDEDGNLVESTFGRTIQITAGFQHVISKAEKKNKVKKENDVLFDVIEDMEESPIQTPFGYDIVPYPLTELTEAQGSTELTEDASKVTDDVTDSVEAQKEGTKTEMELGTEGMEGAEMEEAQKVGATASPEGDDSELEDQMVTLSGAGATTAGSGVVNEGAMPPVMNKRTENGSTVFGNLMLAAAPPMYRPFMVMDEEERLKAAKKKGLPSALEPKKSKEEEAKAAKKKALEDKTSRPGEYVVMAQDVTSPPFMNVTLEPAFIRVKVAKAKKIKKVKDKAPRWDTSKHIQDVQAAGNLGKILEDLSVIEQALGNAV